MKLFTMLLMLGFLSQNVQSAEFASWHNRQTKQQKFLCSSVFALQLKKQIENLPTDKGKHCALSCFLTWRCGSLDAWQIGILKEAWDVVSPGRAEWLDLRANLRGILFGKQVGSGVQADRRCVNLCTQVYPAN